MKRTLLTPDSASGTPPKETEQQTSQRQAARIAELESKLEKYETADAQRAADEKIIVEKMTHGLSRQQAINVIHRQREFDATAKPKSNRRSFKNPVAQKERGRFAESKAKIN